MVLGPGDGQRLDHEAAHRHPRHVRASRTAPTCCVVRWEKHSTLLRVLEVGAQARYAGTSADHDRSEPVTMRSQSQEQDLNHAAWLV